MIDGFQGFSKAFHYTHTNITFIFASLKLLILKMLSETLLRIPFSVIGRCSLSFSLATEQAKN
jgi:hypothetical protein